MRTRPRIGWSLLALIVLLPAPGQAELTLSTHARILEPSDLDPYLQWIGDELWLDLPGGGRWQLDSGQDVYPCESAFAAEAWASVDRAFTSSIEVSIVVLPYPRVALPISSAEDGVIFLSPGVAPYTRRQIHFLLAHEMGHLVHRAYMDHDPDRWLAYRRLRNIEDLTVYHDWAEHANRPRELFAEDFRYLFGGADANYSGSIENAALPLPDAVEGLRSFFLTLVGGDLGSVEPGRGAPSIIVSPVPTRGRVTLQVLAPAGGDEGVGRLAIFDARGRLVRMVGRIRFSEGGVRLEWDGRAGSGQPVATGVYYARLDVRGGQSVTERVVVTR